MPGWGPIAKKVKVNVFLFFRHVQTPNLLVLDCCEPHTGESIVTEFSSHQSNRLIIPGGCTSKLQPLDISLKSMFHVSEYITLQPATVFEFPIVNFEWIGWFRRALLGRWCLCSLERWIQYCHFAMEEAEHLVDDVKWKTYQLHRIFTILWN
jgi:hypothetical protein